MINELNEEQQIALVTTRQEWLDIGTNTEPANRPLAEDAIRRLMVMAGHKVPKRIDWFDGPKQACARLASMKGGDPKQFLSSCLYGQHDAYWIGFYTFGAKVLGVKYEEQRAAQLEAFADLARSAGWWWPYENGVLVSERPEIVRLEHDRTPPRIHCTNGPAIRCRDGFEVYALRGTRVDRRLVMEPETITAAEVIKETNAEVRRIMMAQMGEEKFIRESGLELIGEDSEGKLYARGDLALLRVINSTAEPDGTFKVVYLEVFPTLAEAKQNCLPPIPGMKAFGDYNGAYTPHVARAWTFGVHPDEFVLTAET